MRKPLIPAAPDLRRSRVEAHTILPGVGGKNIGPGQLVDLNEEVGAGLRIRDLFLEEWFEALEGSAIDTAPANRMVDPGEITTRTARPSAKE